MRETHPIVSHGFFIGFLLSTTLLTSLVPIIGMITIPFLFHFIRETRVKVNLSVVTLYIGGLLLLSTASLILFFLSLIDGFIILIFCLLINLLKPLIKQLTSFIFLYYSITTNLLSVLGIYFARSFLNFIPPLFVLLFTCFVIIQIVFISLISRRINQVIKRVFNTIPKPQKALDSNTQSSILIFHT